MFVLSHLLVGDSIERKYLRSFGSNSGCIDGIAIDQAGHIYTADYTGNQVHVFNSKGTCTEMLPLDLGMRALHGGTPGGTIHEVLVSHFHLDPMLDLISAFQVSR